MVEGAVIVHEGVGARGGRQLARAAPLLEHDHAGHALDGDDGRVGESEVGRDGRVGVRQLDGRVGDRDGAVVRVAAGLPQRHLAAHALFDRADDELGAAAKRRVADDGAHHAVDRHGDRRGAAGGRRVADERLAVHVEAGEGPARPRGARLARRVHEHPSRRRARVGAAAPVDAVQRRRRRHLRAHPPRYGRGRVVLLRQPAACAVSLACAERSRAVAQVGNGRGRRTKRALNQKPRRLVRRVRSGAARRIVRRDPEAAVTVVRQLDGALAPRARERRWEGFVRCRRDELPRVPVVASRDRLGPRLRRLWVEGERVQDAVGGDGERRRAARQQPAWEGRLRSERR
mmetsp:Transcript_17078/g.39101  ORF Transcript_17078/g.39101 Transcript_17078/m.39101 type:complete len:345 (-) Transcript_17078:164-1198(-)